MMIMFEKIIVNERISIFQQQTFQSRSSKSNNTFEKWNATNLRFFYFNYDKKIMIIEKTMKHASKDIIFKNVHFFIERAKNIAQIKKEELIKRNLFTCLRDTILTWYTVEFSNDEKKFIKIENDLKVWKRKLITRFKKRSNVIMITIMRKQYIIFNVKNRRESREYAKVIIRIVKSIELDFTRHIVMFIYNELNLKFQRNLSMSTLTTSLN